MIEKNLIFNPDWKDDIDNRTIIHWNTTWLFNLNNVKYSWAQSMYKVMLGNFWIPEKVRWLNKDAIDYNEVLNDDEKIAYDWIISFLTFLDSIQTMNLPNINDYITSPEVNLILSIQAFQEAIHSQSYQTILETVVPAHKREKILYFRREDKHLLQRNKFIWQIYQDFIDKPDDQNLFRSIVANWLLESIYFYNWFAFFDTLADQNKMLATDRMINYIRRDEETHVVIFSNIIREIKWEFPDIYDEQLLLKMMDTAVNQEIEWSKHILNNKIIWMADENIEWYTKYLANQRLESLWINPLYPDATKNPYKHLERIQDQNWEKANFFETTVTNYSQSSSMKWTWDF